MLSAQCPFRSHYRSTTTGATCLTPLQPTRCEIQWAPPVALPYTPTRSCTAAQTDSPARVHLAPDLSGKCKLSPRMHCCQQQKELHRLAFYGRRETKPHQAGFQRALRSQRNMAKWLKTTFPTHRVKTAPFFDLRRGIAIKWGALGRLNSRDNSVEVFMLPVEHACLEPFIIVIRPTVS